MTRWRSLLARSAPLVLWLAIASASAAAWNRAVVADREMKRMDGLFDQYKTRAIDLVRLSLAGVGQTPDWTRLSRITDTPSAASNTAPRLLIAISDAACEECQVREFEFAQFVARKFGSQYVTGIVHADEERFARAMVQQIRPLFDVFYDADATVTHSIGTELKQLLLLLDSRGTVVAAHAPVSGGAEFAEPFHEFVFQYLARSVSDRTTAGGGSP